MARKLPYLAAPGSITTCLNKIRSASTPEKVTTDFVNTKLGIKGGTGREQIPLLKRIGFVNSDGTPTDLYRRFRNRSESGQAVAEAMRIGYAPIYEVNEYAHDLEDEDLKGVIVQATGAESNSRVVAHVLSTFKNLRAFATFDDDMAPKEMDRPETTLPTRVELPGQTAPTKGVGMNLSYTINLNLPATTDIAVFNAIFKSLRENLLRETDD